MEQFLEIIASLIGLIIYWVLTSRKALKREESPTDKPVEPMRPERQRVVKTEPKPAPAPYFPPIFKEEPKPVMEEPEEEEKPRKHRPNVLPSPTTTSRPPQRTAPNTFEELFEQFVNPNKEVAPKMIPASPAQTSGPAFDRDDLYQPLVRGGDELRQGSKKYTGQYADIEIEDIPMPKITIPTLKYGENKQDKVYSRYRKLLRDPQSVKDAFILKEIFDTKYF